MGMIRLSPGGELKQTDYNISGTTGWWEAAQAMLSAHNAGTVAEAYQSGWFSMFPSFSAGDSEKLAAWINDRLRDEAEKSSNPFKSLVAIAAPIVGKFFGPIGTVAGTVAGAALAPKPVDVQQLTQAAPAYSGDTMNARDILRASLPILSPALGDNVSALLAAAVAPAPAQNIVPMQQASILPALPSLGGILGGLGAGAVVSGAIGVVRSVGGKILRFILPSGAAVSRKNAVKLAKEVGLTAAATALGVSAVELAEAIMQEEGKARRGRGITASQLRTTTRTIGKLERAHRQVARAARAHVGRR